MVVTAVTEPIQEEEEISVGPFSVNSSPLRRRLDVLVMVQCVSVECREGCEERMAGV